MSIAHRMKEAGGMVLAFAGLLGMIAIGVGLLVGAAEFSVWILAWTAPAFSITFLILIVLLLCSCIPALRGFSAMGMAYASLGLGLILWIWGMSYTYLVWGMFGVVAGLVFLGIGVVPVAMVAALLHADWKTLGLFVVAILITFGSRALAHWLAKKADERAMRLSRADIDLTAREISDQV